MRPLSAASRAVVSTQALVDTPVITSEFMPLWVSCTSMFVELKAPKVVLFMTGSPAPGLSSSRILKDGDFE